MGKAAANGLRVLLLGSSTPVGAEVKRRWVKRRVPVREAILAEFEALDEEGGRLLAEYDGQAQLVTPAAEIEFTGFDLAVLCGSAEEIAPLLPQASQARLAVDLSGACRGRADVPWYHHAIEPLRSVPPSGLVGAPHPVAATLASILYPLAHDGLLAGAGATVLLPASALGKKAVDELYRQTLGLLNFTDWPREHLAHQLAFNVLPFEHPARPGSGSLAEEIGVEIGRLLGSDAPGCDLQILLAPTFDGFGYSLRLAVPSGVTAQELSRCLTAAGLGISSSAEEVASPVEAVRKEGILISRIRQAGDGVCWLWAVADSLGGGAAENAVRLAEELARSVAGQGGA